MPCFVPQHLRQRRTYSEDVRELVIYQKYTLKKKTADISCDLNMAQRVVERTLKIWRETGEVVPQGPGRKGRRMRLMTAAEVEVSNRSILFPGLPRLTILLSF